MERGGALAQSVARLYELFAPFDDGSPVTLSLECGCCASEEDALALAKTPARALDAKMLAVWVQSAHGAGPSSDVSRFLPRIVDLFCALDSPSSNAPFLVLDRADAHAWSEWPEAERAAVSAAFDAVLDAVLDEREPLFGLPIDEALFFLVWAGYDVERLVSRWSAKTDPGATERLAELAFCTTAGGFRNAFASPTENASPRVRRREARLSRLHAWLHETATMDRLLAAQDPPYDPETEKFDHREAWARLDAHRRADGGHRPQRPA